MPVSKTDLFTNTEKKIAIIGRALSHPARIRIFELIHQNGFVTNCDLMNQLKLTNASVSNHIRKLNEAKLIKIEYHPNHFQIFLRQNSLTEISHFAETY